MPANVLGDEGDESGRPRGDGELHASPHVGVLVGILMQDVEVGLELILLAHFRIAGVVRIVDHYLILASSMTI